MTTPVIGTKKGNELERAVELVERAIVAANQTLFDATFNIERKKMIVREGVKHEVDVMVTVNPGKPSETFHIFEFKNWNRPVGKREVILFQDLITETKAAKGYLVAESFTKGARTKAASCRSMILTPVSRDFPTLFGDHNLLHTETDFMSVSARITDRAAPERTPLMDMNLTTVQCRLNGTEMPFRDLLVREANRIIDEYLVKRKDIFKLEGQHARDIPGRLVFQLDELTIAGVDVAVIEITAHVRVLSDWATVVSRYDVMSRGRVHSFHARDDLRPDRPLLIEFVQVDSQHAPNH